MFHYVFKRLLTMIPTLLVISFIIFVIIQLPPGDYLETHIAELESQGESVDPEKIKAEIIEARRLFTKMGWPVIDVTRRSIEETASEIISHYDDWLDRSAKSLAGEQQTIFS